jgi:DNA repair exonuclease SbcCD ATPase subunit
MELQDDVDRLRHQTRKLLGEIEEAKGKENPELAHASSRVKKTKLELAKYPALDKEKVSLQKEAHKKHREAQRNLHRMLDRARDQKADIVAEQQEYDDLDKMVGKRCPTCKHKVTQKHAAACREEFMRRIRKEAKAVLTCIRSYKSQLEEVNGQLRNDEKTLRRVEHWNEERGRLQSVLEAARERLSKLKDAAQQQHGDVRALQARVEKTSEEIIKTKNRRNPYRSLIRQQKKEIRKLKQRLEKNKQDQLDTAATMERLKKAKRAFSREGIRSLLLSQFVLVLNERSNHYLNPLSTGKMQVEFSTQKEVNKGKEMRDEFTMRIIHLGHSRRYRRCSSGERRRVDLAIMLSLSDLLKTRRHRSFNLLWLDEVADPLDDEGCQNLAVLLKKKAAESKMRIYLVAFNKALANMFDSRIQVINEKGIARLDMSKAA